MAMTELERMAREILDNHFRDTKWGWPPEAIGPVMTALTKAPPGWKLVPLISTTKMDEEIDFHVGCSQEAGELYAALLAAAPEYKEGE